jgi:thioredoxin reductase (NADPH)
MRRAALIVIGAGPAGCAAAVQGRRLGLEVRLWDESGRAGGLIRQAHRVENYPGIEPLDGPALAARLAEHVARFGIAVEARRAERVAAGAGGPQVTARDSGGRRETLEAAAAILAVGTRPRRSGIAGEDELEGRTLFFEVRDLLRAVPAPRRVVVIGAGEAALDYALTLADAGAEVCVLARGREPRAAQRLVEATRSHRAIEVRTGIAAERLLPDGGGVRLALEAPRSSLTADAVLVAVGREPRTGEILDAGETGPDAAGIHVVGDARLGCLGQVGIAVGDGLAAAMRAARP